MATKTIRQALIAALLIVALALQCNGMSDRHLKKPVGARFNPVHNSFLHYMANIRRHGEAELRKACSTRTYDWTVYYRLVYMKICNNVSAFPSKPAIAARQKMDEPFSRFCFLLEEHYGGNTSDNVEQIDEMANKFKVYGPGQTAVQRRLAYKACNNIKDYYRKANESQYTEWLIHTIPFSLPVACGYSYAEYNKTLPSSYDCLGTSGQVALYSTFVIDGLIVTCILVANILVLVVILRSPVMRNVHGFYRVNLACADLLIGCVLSASMNTTHTMYLERHQFLEEGRAPAMSDYHDQLYVDAFGFLTVLSLAASVFTLVAISAERYVIERKRHAYNVKSKRSRCCIGTSIVVIWLVAFVVALIPIVYRDMPYTVTALGVIIAPWFYIAYVICFGVSLLAVWTLNVMLYITTRKGKKAKHTKSNKSKIPCDKKNEKQKESYVNLDVTSTDACEQATIPVTSQTSSASRDVQAAIPGVAEQSAVDEPACEGSLDDVSTSAEVTSDKTKRVCVSEKASAHDATIVKTIRAVVIAFTIAILSPIAVMLWNISMTLEPRSVDFDAEEKAAWNSLSYLGSRVLFANSFFNVIIYSCTNPVYWKATKGLVAGRGGSVCCRKKNDGNTDVSLA